MRDSEDKVLSPPDKLEICFQDFLGGLTVKLIPSEKGSKESTNSNSASPPLVMSFYFKNMKFF